MFYDYDEIQPMEEMSFRRIPPPRSYEEELAAEPYWSVGPTDVFPEQFGASSSAIRARASMTRHAPRPARPGILERASERVRAGLQEDVFPYPDEIGVPARGDLDPFRRDLSP